MIFIMIEKEILEQARLEGYYVAPSLKTEGFIHCSLQDQVVKVADRKFRGKKNLVLLEIDEKKVVAEIKFEGSSERYPHIYGRLNLDAVVKVYSFQPKDDGTFSLPTNFLLE